MQLFKNPKKNWKLLVFCSLEQISLSPQDTQYLYVDVPGGEPGDRHTLGSSSSELLELKNTFYHLFGNSYTTETTYSNVSAEDFTSYVVNTSGMSYTGKRLD